MNDKWLTNGTIGENGIKILLTHSERGIRFNRPIEFTLPKDMRPEDENIYNYIVSSLTGHAPRLIPFACESESIFNLAKYLRRGCSSSPETLHSYVGAIARFTRWCKRAPDELIKEAKCNDGTPDVKRLMEHSDLMENFIGYLQAEGLAPNSISDYTKAMKSLYRVNKLELTLPYEIKCIVKYEDRAPTAEELQRLIDIGDIREKAIVSMLALGGFRIGTLSKLKYRHVKRDLESGMVPVHVHVEAEITKGKYHSYDTFLSRETVDYLKTYLDTRHQGTLRMWRYETSTSTRPVGIPPEEITDESPLFRNAHDAEVKPLRPCQIYMLVHTLYRKAGLLYRAQGHRNYDLRAHSIRKFFKTQLTALGVTADYIEYMMGHKKSVYLDIRNKGIEFLRNVYAGSGLSIKPKTRATRLDLLKEMVKAWGMDPEKVLVQDAFAEPHRVFVSPAGTEEDQIKVLSGALKEMLKKELLDGGVNSCK